MGNREASNGIQGNKINDEEIDELEIEQGVIVEGFNELKSGKCWELGRVIEN